MGRTKSSITDRSLRKEKIKALMLKGVSITDIANQVGVTIPTVYADVNEIQEHYAKMALANPNIAEKQYAEVLKLKDEVTLIKKEFYDVFDSIKQTEEANRKEHEESKILSEQNIKEHVESVEKNKQGLIQPTEIVPLTNLIVPLKDFSHKKIDTLKAILVRVEQDAKLLNLFNPSTLIVNQYISINDLKQILDIVKNIIVELVPDEKKQYAFDRLKGINISPTKGKDIIDAEMVEKPSQDVAKPTQDSILGGSDIKAE